MIVATAGHVDHGKSMLVKALTGVDTDRLPEEKRRGLTIDLGFAYLPVGPECTIGFVDVPGHERFIRNMLCGFAGIDFALLVVAADDGPMPQTREHLAIIDLLGVPGGAVALTKVDRVDAQRVAQVRREIENMIQPTALADAPVFPLSAISGDGVESLRAHLQQAALDQRPKRAAGNFRLAVDRSFTLAGAGRIVTGTCLSGSVAVGDRVKAAVAGLTARVRSIHAQNAPAKVGRAGDRCALNLVGTDLGTGSITRGDWVVGGDAPQPVQKIDARIRILGSEQKAFAHWTPVHVHLGAADLTGRVAILNATNIQPGESALVQLVLDRPVSVVHGDRLIIRDQSSRRTVGGGQVIDIFPPARGRAKPQRLAYLAGMENGDVAKALNTLLDGAADGLDLSKFAASRNLGPAEAARLLASVPLRAVATESGLLGFSASRWNELRAKALAALSDWHRLHPEVVGPSEDRVLHGSGTPVCREATIAVVAELVEAGAMIRSGTSVSLPGHRPRLLPADARLWQRIEPLLRDGGLRSAPTQEIAQAIGLDPDKARSLLARIARQGLIVKVSQARFFLPLALNRLARIAQDLADDGQSGLVSAAAFRDRSGIGRNLTIEVLEFFDRTKFTRREGEARRVMRPAGEIFADTASTFNMQASTIGNIKGRESHPGGAPGLQIRREA